MTFSKNFELTSSVSVDESESSDELVCLRRDFLCLDDDFRLFFDDLDCVGVLYICCIIGLAMKGLKNIACIGFCCIFSNIFGSMVGKGEKVGGELGDLLLLV